MERGAAGDQEPQARSCRDQTAQRFRSIQQMLEVVEEDQRLTAAQVRDEVVPGAELVRNARQHELGVAETCERHPEDAVGEALDQFGGDLERQPGLPRAAGAGDRHHLGAVLEQGRQLDRARDYGRARGWTRPAGSSGSASAGREFARAELVDALGRGMVLQPLLTEVEELEVVAGEAPRGVRDETWPPWPAAMTRAAR